MSQWLLSSAGPRGGPGEGDLSESRPSQATARQAGLWVPPPLTDGPRGAGGAAVLRPAEANGGAGVAAALVAP